jgi:hypothetical protein
VPNGTHRPEFAVHLRSGRHGAKMCKKKYNTDAKNVRLFRLIKTGAHYAAKLEEHNDDD